MDQFIRNLALIISVGCAWVAVPFSAAAADPQIERGRYLTSFGGCFDCHTPGYFFGKPDMARYLGGSDVGFAIPGRGVFVGPNLTPDKETGLGNWTKEQIVTALQTGTRPDGRVLAPIMPWRSFAKLTRQDATAIAAYLKSLPPLAHKVPGPFGPDEKPTVPVMKIVQPEDSASK
jgi:mono/diheme cytochrome c family protein